LRDRIKKKSPGAVRIIGGLWRGRRLPVPDQSGLRPTPDRVRETLFNWLAPYLPGAACLDLFAGTGVLGLEALSRGAQRAVLVEQGPAAVRSLRESVALLNADAAEVVGAEALAWLQRIETSPFDIVFLDPPYASGLQAPALEQLLQRGLVAPDGFVYLEFPRGGTPEIPATGFELYRTGHAGDVEYLLLRFRTD
jgi:16S rRNA (guanine966-N2)-methyltransferase